jgi:hypothetical protein
MSDDHASLCGWHAYHGRKHASDVFIGQTVEAIATDAFLREPAWERELGRDVWLRVVKRRVETSDLAGRGAAC